MASDYLLEIDGIKGESKDDKHKETIEISSFSWGCTNNGSFRSGSGGGSGKVAFDDVTFWSSAHKASPLLFLACATGQHIKKATLFVRKAGGEQHDYYKVTLEDVLISGMKHYDEGDDGGIPDEEFSLNFAKVKFEYCPQDEKGALGGATAFGYDLKANKKV